MKLSLFRRLAILSVGMIFTGILLLDGVQAKTRYVGGWSSDREFTIDHANADKDELIMLSGPEGVVIIGGGTSPLMDSTTIRAEGNGVGIVISERDELLSKGVLRTLYLGTEGHALRQLQFGENRGLKLNNAAYINQVVLGGNGAFIKFGEYTGDYGNLHGDVIASASSNYIEMTNSGSRIFGNILGSGTELSVSLSGGSILQGNISASGNGTNILLFGEGTKVEGKGGGYTTINTTGDGSSIDINSGASVRGNVIMNGNNSTLTIDGDGTLVGSDDASTQVIIEVSGNNSSVTISSKAVAYATVRAGASGSSVLIQGGATLNGPAGQLAAEISNGATLTVKDDGTVVNGGVSIGSGSSLTISDSSTINGDVTLFGGSSASFQAAQSVTAGDVFIYGDGVTASGNLYGAGNSLYIYDGNFSTGSLGLGKSGNGEKISYVSLQEDTSTPSEAAGSLEIETAAYITNLGVSKGVITLAAGENNINAITITENPDFISKVVVNSAKNTIGSVAMTGDNGIFEIGNSDFLADGTSLTLTKGTVSIAQDLNTTGTNSSVVLGTSSDRLHAINLAAGKTLTMNNNAFVDDLYLDGAASKLIMGGDDIEINGSINVNNSTAVIEGTLKGAETSLKINADYVVDATNNNTLNIGKDVDNMIGEVIVNGLDGNVATSVILSRLIYADKLTMKGNSNTNITGQIGNNIGSVEFDGQRSVLNITNQSNFKTSAGADDVANDNKINIVNISGAGDQMGILNIADNFISQIVDYSGTDPNQNYANVTLGASGKSLYQVNMIAGKSFTLSGVDAYVENTNLGGNLTIGNGTFYSGSSFDNSKGNAINKGVMFQYDSSIVLNSGGTIMGDIYSTADLQGSINVNGTSAIYGNIGSSTGSAMFGGENFRIKSINIAAGNYTFTLGGLDTDFIMNSNAFMDTNTLMERAYFGILDFTNATNDNTLRITGDRYGYLLDANIQYDSNGKTGIVISLNGDKPGSGANKTQADDFINLIGDTYEQGFSSVIVADNSLYFKALDSNTLIAGDTIFITNLTNEELAKANPTLVYDSILLSLKAQIDGNKLELYVEDSKQLNGEDSSGSIVDIGNIINNWGFDLIDAGQSSIIRNLQNIKDNNEFYRALGELTPDTSTMLAKTSMNVLMNANLNIAKRLDTIRMMGLNTRSILENVPKPVPQNNRYYYDDYYTAPYRENATWGELFGGMFSVSDADKFIYGYDTIFQGGTVGYDRRTSRDTYLGASYTFAYSKAEGDTGISSSDDELSAMSHSANIYGMYSFRNAFFLNFTAGGTLHQYKQKRKISFGDYAATAKADFNGYSYSAGVGGGFNIVIRGKDGKVRMNKLNTPRSSEYVAPSFGDHTRTVVITPTASINYTRMMFDDYEETGADAANLSVKWDNMDLLTADVGLNVTVNTLLNDDYIRQMLFGISVSRDLMNNEMSGTATLLADGKSFKINGMEPEDILYNGKLGYYISLNDVMSAGLEYNYSFNSDVSSHLIKASFVKYF